MSQSNQDFLKKRRQPFLTERYYLASEKEAVKHGIPERKQSLTSGKLQGLDLKYVAYGQAKEYLHLLHLRYTAGYPIEKLAKDLDEVVSAWEDFAKIQREFLKQPDDAAFDFAIRVDYNHIIQLVGIAILLCRTDLLPRVNRLCFIYRGEDFLYDELLYPFVAGHVEAEEYKLFHEYPYETLIDVLESEDPAEQSALMKEAVEDWYGDNEGEPFHDTHKRISDDGSGGYFGYWCFELAALCVIHKIDDVSFREHITYPKDLVDYCRANLDLTKPALSANSIEATRLRAEAGQPCPREGFYFTPAKVNSRKFFKQGEIMPKVGGDYGATIWQWDGQQG